MRDEIKRLRKALEEINSQAVCAVIATEGECFQMLQNCAEISEAALSYPPVTEAKENPIK